MGKIQSRFWYLRQRRNGSSSTMEQLEGPYILYAIAAVLDKHAYLFYTPQK